MQASHSLSIPSDDFERQNTEGSSYSSSGNSDKDDYRSWFEVGDDVDWRKMMLQLDLGYQLKRVSWNRNIVLVSIKLIVTFKNFTKEQIEAEDPAVVDHIKKFTKTHPVGNAVSAMKWHLWEKKSLTANQLVNRYGEWDDELEPPSFLDAMMVEAGEVSGRVA